MKIAATGYYGFSNFGDDLFIIALDIAAKKYWPPHQLTIISPQLRKTDSATYIVPKWIPKKIYASNTFTGKVIRSYYMIKGMAKSDQLINAGGTTISSDSNLNKLYIQYSLRNILRCKIAGVGLSIGPFVNKIDEQKASRILECFNYISVRDSTSFKQLQTIPEIKEYTLSADMAGLVAQKYQFYKTKKNDRILGISLMEIKDPLNNASTSSIHEFFETIVKFAKENNKTIRVISLNNHQKYGDRIICRKFINTLNSNSIECELIIHNNNPISTWEKIAECSKIISFRLHGAIAAYLSGVPFLLIEQHRKCSDFLNDIGHPHTERIKDIRESKKITHFLGAANTQKSNYQQYIEKSLKNFSSSPWANSTQP